MIETTSTPAVARTSSSRNRRPRLASMLTFALWRWRQHWFLLLMICSGLIASVVMVCSVPLLSEIMQTAELRSVMRASSNNSEITLATTNAGLSSQGIQHIFQQVNSPIQQHLGSYLNSSPRLDIQTPYANFIAPTPPESQDSMEIYGASLQAAASHVTLVQGRLPQAQTQPGAVFEVAITGETASLLHVQVGSHIVLNWAVFPAPPYMLITSGKQVQATYIHVTLQVVGLMTVKSDDPFWHGANFFPDQTTGRGVTGDLGVKYTALASEQGLLSTLDRLAASQQTDQVYFQEPSTLTWYYAFNPSQISINQLNDLRQRLALTQSSIATYFGDPIIERQQPYIKQVSIASDLFNTAAVPSVLEQFSSQLNVAQIPLIMLTAFTLALLLFFVGLMAGILVDRQADAIALMRSRGVSSWQITGMFATLSVALGLIALIVGPLLAILTIFVVATRLLPETTRDAVNVVTGSPLQTLLLARWYILATVVISTIALALMFFRATRQSATATLQIDQRPLWRRLNLDIVAVIVALVGFGISLYLASVGQYLNQQTQQTIVTPLSLVAPIFILIAGILLLLRVFPWLLQLGSNFAMRGRGAVPMLAVAQMARTPRQSLRMMLLLALAISFALFTLVFAASQGQRGQDIATYLAGADFSGDITDLANTVYLPAHETAVYLQIPGVLNATAGYIEADVSSANSGGAFVQLAAVDPSTFLQSTIWTSRDSTQSPASLMAQLAAGRSSALHSGTVPAIVDANTWNALKLHLGSTFSLYRASSLSGTMNYVVVGELQHIPGITDLNEGSMLVDFQSFATIQQQKNSTGILSNHVWLLTRSNAASLASVRNALASSYYRLNNLLDRRALTTAMQNDSLSLNLIGLLALGASTALILALAGDLLMSWLSVRRRLASFVMLRALGADQKQIAGVLLWEQGIIYAAALLLGVLFGILLVTTAVSSLIFTPFPAGLASNFVSVTEFYTLQNILPPQIVIPLTLGIALCVLVVIFVLALVLMVFMVRRPSMSQALRVDENLNAASFTREEMLTISLMPHRAIAARANRSFSPTFLTLARWQVRRAWGLLLVQGVGMLAVVVIVCIVPLFATVTTTAGLQNTLNAIPNTTTITLDATTQGISSSVLTNAQQQFDPFFQHYIGAYMSQPAQFSLQAANLRLLSATPENSNATIGLVGTPMNQVASYVHLVQGNLPQETSDNVIEALLTPQAAQGLHVAVGSQFTLRGDFYTNPQDMFGGSIASTATMQIRVVGLFNITNAGASYFQGQNFLPIGANPSMGYTLLVPNQALLSEFDQLAASAHADTVFSPQTFQLTWRYPLDTSRININQLDALTYNLTQLQATIENAYSNIQNAGSIASGLLSSPYLVQVNLYNPTPGSYTIVPALNQYHDRVTVVSIPIDILVLQIIGLILLFISLVANLLVERQAEAIAIMRSRGATNQQIFSSFLVQIIGLGIFAFVAGPLLAVVIVTFLSLNVLGSAGHDAVTLITGQPLQAALSVGWYAAGIVLVVLLVMIFLLWRAARLNFLAVRREAARTTQPPLWRRLNLDIIAALIALVGYIIALYLGSAGNTLDLRTQELVAAPLALIAPLFLLIAALLLFLRLFGALLQLGARLTTRGRSAVSMLALAQMSRAPRQHLRMILLVGLTVAFALFTLIFSASQTQHILDTAAYETGADFSGTLPLANQQIPAGQAAAQYRQVDGITAASAGYVGSGAGATPGTPLTLPLQIRAVDASTFAQTAIWIPQNASPSLATLMSELVATRANSLQSHQIPVIVDAATLSRLDLQVGDNFTITINDLPYNMLTCIVVAQVAHIPTINDSSSVGSTGNSLLPGGILLDYTTLAEIYAADLNANNAGQGQTTQTQVNVPLNHIWLSTSDDPAALTRIRTLLTSPSSSSYLTNLLDRRALVETMSADSLSQQLLILLAIGATTALLLTLVGSLLASWISVRTRLTNFVLLRSLGASPRQVVSILLWEQVLVYVSALLLGIVAGLIFAVSAVPALAFSGTPSSGVLSSITSDEFFALQRVIPAPLVFPLTLALAFIMLVAIVILALGIMARAVLQPSMSQSLRLNED